MTVPLPRPSGPRAVTGTALRSGHDRTRRGGSARAPGADPQAVRYVLDTMVATPAGALREVPVPTLIVVGEDDSRGATAGDLAALLPSARLRLVPGDHLTALEAPELLTAVLDFLVA